MLSSLQCPSGKRRIEYCDTELPGFYVEVRDTSEGRGTFYLRYKDVTGKTCHQKIGRTSDIGLVDARKQATALKAEIVKGADPRAEDKARKAVITLTEFYDEHYKPFVSPRKRSWRSDEQLFLMRIKPRFGELRLNQITRQQIIVFHNELKEEGLAGATSDHYVKLLRRAFNLAIEWGFVDKNPASRVKLFNLDNKVEHYLDEDQLQKLLKVLRTDSSRPVCMIAMFLLSTGARLSEALHAKWEQVDARHRVWRIPAINSKSKRMRSVPLNDSAIDILKQLDSEGESDYLFVNRQTGKPYAAVHKVWERLRNEAGLPHLRIHDLRHQYASFLVNSGRTLYEVQQILGHSDPTVTQRYAHLSSKSLQEAANSASVIINEAMLATT
jgi:site-specific recombinase XerD